MNGGEPFSPKEEPTKANFSRAETLEAVQWLTDSPRTAPHLLADRQPCPASDRRFAAR